MVTVIVGLPGTGKTSLAVALAAQTGALVLHTDLLKVTLRQTAGFPSGPAWSGDVAVRLDAARPVLDAHVGKARDDGYDLVVEGTLAAGLPGDRVVLLALAEGDRLRRCAAKHASAAEALTAADLSRYAAELHRRSAGALELDASEPIAALVGRLTAL